MENLSDEQLIALQKMEEFVKNKEPVLVLQGFAGTGKSFILNEYVQYLDSNDINFVLCAPTHKAKLVVEEMTKYEAITVHKLLSLSPNIEIFNLDYKDLKFQSKGFSEVPTDGIVIIDEASMITDNIYKLLLEFCKENNSKLLFVGDKAQLQGINNGHTSKVFNCNNKITLTKIFRQTDQNGLLPILSDLRTEPLKKFKPVLAKEGSLYVYNKPKDFMLEAKKFFDSAVNNQNTDEVKLIAYTNARVFGLNKCIRRLLWKGDKEYNTYEFLTGYENFEYNKNQFYNSCDYVVINPPYKLDKKIPYFNKKLVGYDLCLYDKIYKSLLGVFILSRGVDTADINDLSAIIEDIRMSAIEAGKNNLKSKSKSYWRKYFEIMKSFATPNDMMFDNRVIKKKTFDYGYAITDHKVQGSSINTIFVDMNNLFVCRDKEELRQLQYVALSRTKKDAHILI
jgi:hypothetical protein